ncbi:MAG: LamG domain-containing protein [Cyclobacteriaceae bacterium]
MKVFKFIFFSLIIVTLIVACDYDNFIDPITPVEPGQDESAPIISINYPTNDVIIPFTEDETDLNFRFRVEDDIEVQNVQISLNGTELTTFSNFKDYRKVIENFTYEDLPLGNYTFSVTATDINGKSTTQSITFELSNKYSPKYDGEVFYMPFEGQLFMEMINETNATVMGNPGFTTTSAVGSLAYAGADGSYLTFPVSALDLGEEFSATFWLDVKEVPDNRAGILVIGPPDPDAPDNPNNRKSGFRFFREGSATNQVFKLNVGNGTADTWVDGGADAAINPDEVTGYVHLAFTISSTHARVYLNGDLARETEFTGISWDQASVLSIMSGAPYFTGWDHLSDVSFMDELRIFNKALTQQQIQQIIDDES